MLPINPARIPALFKAARAAEVSGRLHEAEAQYRTILSVNPRLPEVQFNLGRVLARTGRAKAAREALEAALALRPKEQAIWAALFSLERQHGNVGAIRALARRAEKVLAPEVIARLAGGAGQAGERRRVGAVDPAPGEMRRLFELMGKARFAEAESIAIVLAEKHPRSAAVATVRATAQAELGKLAQAEASFRAALGLNPDYPEALAFFGEFLIAQGRSSEAVHNLERAHALAPKLPRALLGLIHAKLDAGRTDQAAILLDEAKRVVPGNARLDYLNGICDLLRQRASAVGHLQRAIRKGDKSLRAQVALAEALDLAGRTDEALAKLDDLLAHHHTSTYTREVKARILNSIGRFADAQAELRAAIAIAPRQGSLYLTYVRVRKIAADDPLIAQMEQSLNSDELDWRDRMYLSYAMAKAMEDTGQSGRIFRYLDAANALMAKAYPYGFEADQRQLRKIRDRFTPALRRRYEGHGFEPARPIFVTGLPRSGTTLVEQIIASHSSVEAAGEIGTLSPMMNTLLDRLAAGDGKAKVDFRALGNTYWSDLRHRFPGAAHITDKSISNFSRIGYIKLAMPNARIIVVRRDLRDNGLSIYKNLFKEGMHRYSANLREIARFQKLFEVQMAFWARTWPEAFCEIRYEALIAEPEAQARELIAACGLEWEDACLSFYENTRRVDTLSVYQVRQPIYSSSVGAWKRHERELAPLIDELAGEG